MRIRYFLVALALGATAFLLGRSHEGRAAVSRPSAKMQHVQASLADICPSLVAAEIGESNSRELLAAIDEASETYSVRPELLIAVAAAESQCESGARSPRGAVGIMQLMPATATWLGVNDPFSVRENVLGGAKYLSYLLNRYKGNQRLALSAYNAGPETVRKAKAVPQITETKRYVKKVLALYTKLLSQGEAVPVEEA